MQDTNALIFENPCQKWTLKVLSTVEFKVMWYVEDKRHLKWKPEHDIPGNTFSLSWNIFIYIDIYTCTNYTPFLENCFEMFILSGLLIFFL